MSDQTTGGGAATGEPTDLDQHKIVTILAPKGGAGKTMVATNLAVGLAKRHPRQVVLLDLDLQFGDVAPNLRLQPKSTIVDVARKWPVDSAQLKLALTAHDSGLYALCAPANPADADEVNAAHVAGVVSALQRSFRYVIIDTDPGLSERVLSALDHSTEIVMVCSKEVPSIRALRKAIEALDMVGLTHSRRVFVLNRSDTRVGLDIDDVERTIGQTIDVRVPSSVEMVLATNDGVPVMMSGRSEELVDAFEKLVDVIDKGTVGADAGRGGLRLFKRKG